MLRWIMLLGLMGVGCALLLSGAAHAADSDEVKGLGLFLQWMGLNQFTAGWERLIAFALGLIFIYSVLCLVASVVNGKSVRAGLFRRLARFFGLNLVPVKSPDAPAAQASGAAMPPVERREGNKRLEELLKKSVGDGNGTKGRVEKRLEVIEDKLDLGQDMHVLFLMAINEWRASQGKPGLPVPKKFLESCNLAELRTLCNECGFPFPATGEGK